MGLTVSWTKAWSSTDDGSAFGGADIQNIQNNITSGDITFTGQTQGDILYYGGSAWARLAAGTAGQFLYTGGSSANPSWRDDWNPQALTSTAAQTEGAGTETDVDFGATDTITVTINGNQSVVILFRANFNNNDATGRGRFVITDSANATIGTSDVFEDQAVASEGHNIFLSALDTRPASGTKVYKARFNRTVAGTVSLDARSLIVFTFPDPA